MLAILYEMLTVVVLAYYFYLDLEKGELDPIWKDEYHSDFWKFRDVISSQRLN